MGQILDSYCHRFPDLSNREQIGRLTDVRRYSSPIPLSIGIINSFRVKNFSLVFRPPLESGDAHRDKVKKNFQGNQKYVRNHCILRSLSRFSLATAIEFRLYLPYKGFPASHKTNFPAFRGDPVNDSTSPATLGDINSNVSVVLD